MFISFMKKNERVKDEIRERMNRVPLDVIVVLAQS